MAIGDVRFTWSERKRLHRILIVAVSTNGLVGLVLFAMGTVTTLSYAGRLRTEERSLFDLVYKTLTIYGLYVLVHSLMGLKLCRNYFRYAEGSWSSLRLFVWTILGVIGALVGCFMASVCFSTAEQLVLQVRESLLEGMKKYFTDVTWKRGIDSLQVNLRCCGIDSSDDWHKTYWLQRELLVLDSPDILKYAELDGRVTPPVVPWSCCRTDVKGPCYHDPLQLTNPEQNSTYLGSLYARGCLVVIKTMLNGTLYSVVPLIVLLFVLQVVVTVLSRLDFTAARNAVALGNRKRGSPGWLYGRLDFGNAAGPNLCQIERVSEPNEINR
ncbi:Photoreceptor outer segment membrane glycoprotein 2 [Dufourea novaeangliae]|uniref:Photoreceptor outer segment membrane glycoprotein 2 n=1 Tax=Dufourea novaeangliae TaxID=178035 RepID=A0A154PLU0_DUFNO|nr:Photoreceptor outer segment membrane glycoprotein 2 [Dufourea novaeangliae]